MTTIAYDYALLDLIDELNETEHVTHTQHRKTKVTLHHNGGRLSHYGVLSVWQVRPASAHFNIDAAGNGAQFVRVNEYAWATGSTVGNADSISIEMCNETLGPEWRVGEATWKGAARLAGWLLARVIGERPNSNNLVRHKYWSSTECAGPYIDKIYPQILLLAQQTYDRIVSGGKEEDDMDKNTVFELVSPGSVERGEKPPWTESRTLQYALERGYYLGSDGYATAKRVESQLAQWTATLQAVVNDNRKLRAELDQIKTGGVSRETIKEIAIEAIDEQLGPK